MTFVTWSSHCNRFFSFSICSVVCSLWQSVHTVCISAHRIQWSILITLCQPNKSICLIHLPWMAFQKVSLNWTKTNICVKRAEGLLIIEDNTILFNYCGNLNCSLAVLETSALTLLYTLMFLPDKRSLLSKGVVELTKLPSNNSNTVLTRFNLKHLFSNCIL